MKLKDIKFKDNKFDAQWLIDLHNMETGDNKSLNEFIAKYGDTIPSCQKFIPIADVDEPPLNPELDKGLLFKFVEWLDMRLYLDLMKLAVDSLGWANVKQS